MRSLCVRGLAWTCLAAVLGLTVVPAGGQVKTEPPDGGAVILDTSSLWRWRVSWRKPIVPADAMKAAGKDAAETVLPVQRVPFTSRPDIELLETAAPPAEWVQPEFDDGDWPRNTAGFVGGGSLQAGLICLRGKFAVSDPAAAGRLTISARYRGGIVVYLNGKEVARGDMPEGPTAAATAAVPYPLEAWVDDKGQMLPNPSRMAARIKAGEKTLEGRIEKRTRRLESVQIPPAALRKGVNVLAVAVHRGDYHPVAVNWFNQENIHSRWHPIGLDELRLTSVGGGVSPNTARPAGNQVFNLDIHQRIDGSYYGDPNEPLRPVRIRAARNGTFSGMVAVGSDKPLRNVTARVSDLAGATSSIPASAMDVRFVLLTDGPVHHFTSSRPLSFDGLSPVPPAEPPLARGGSVQPIWLAVRVPRDAAPGDYKGSLTVSADGVAAVQVPVELVVADWAVPDPRAFRTHAGIYQSPTSLAMQYKVKEWSEEHWKLMDASFALLARAGNDLVNIPVVEQTQFGNDEGMVYWVRKPDGTFDYDFAVLDRYLELVGKHLGAPAVVALQVWHSGGWEVRKADEKNTVTVIDPKTRQRIESLQVPVFGTEESKRFWTPVLHAIRDRLAKGGMDKSLCLGILSDGTAPPEVFRMFAEILPEAGWTRGCHTVTRAPGPYNISGSSKVVYHEFCYGMSIPDPAKGIAKVYDLARCPGTAYFRSDFDNLPPMGFHLTAERALYQQTRGFGRNCLDFWDFKDDRNRYGNIFNRYPHSSVGQREPTVTYLACAGPDGPLSTIRYELILAGLQEADAVIAIAEAADRQAERIGPDLAGRCRKLLIDRVNGARVVNGYAGPEAWDYAGWTDRTAELFKLAGEIAAKLK